MLTRCSIDALNPKRAEITFSCTPVAIGILQPLLDALDGDAEIGFRAAAITTGSGQYLFMSGVELATGFLVI